MIALQVMLPESGVGQEYVEDTPDIMPSYSHSSSAWHTPVRDSVCSSPAPNFSPAYSPDDYTWWSATGCKAGNGEKFDPCPRSTIYIAEVSHAPMSIYLG